MEYVPLRAAVRGTAAAGVEWLVNDKNGNDVKTAEARLIASRIRQLVDCEVVRDPETGKCRPCTFSDIAILARSRLVLRGLERVSDSTGSPSTTARRATSRTGRRSWTS